MSETLKFRPLKAEEVEVRVGTCSDKGCSLLLYKTARTDAAMLDETVGPENWQCDYRSIDGKLFCGIGCRFKDGEWVWKWDTGTPNAMEPQKSEASDAFKRSGFKWGIGVELYTSPFIWVPADKLARHSQSRKNGKWQCYDDFCVTDMEVDGGQIVKLTVCNMSRKGQVVYGSKQEAKKQAPKNGRFDKVRKLKEKAISLGVREDGIESWITATFKGKPKKDMSDSEIKMTEAYLAGLIRDMAELEAAASEGMNPNA